MVKPENISKRNATQVIKAEDHPAGRNTPEERAEQYAALCYRLTAKGKLRVLMITSRGIGRWITPKGWPMRGRAPWDAALIEAWEEAGVRGTVQSQALGAYEYYKWRNDAEPLLCRVTVYPVHVTCLEDEFPEAGQRRRQWFSTKDAAQHVAEPKLAEILSSFRLKSLKRTAN